MKSALVVLLGLLVGISSAASGSLFISAPPYECICIIGGPNENQVVQVQLASNESKSKWLIEAKECKVTKYNQEKKELQVEYSPSSGVEGPPAFILTIAGNKGTITVGDHSYAASCDWKL